MGLELTRSDYSLLGLSNPQCMKLLPQVGLKGLNKVAFGGHDGVLQVFSLKKQEMQIGFKTLPGDPISVLQLGGSIGATQDKIFIASKTEVRGFTKKGKLFLGLDTNMTEYITSMDVSGSDLLVSGSHLYNHYRDCKDVNSYLSSDRINHIIALPIEKTHRLISVLACEDRILRVLERSTVSQSIPLHSPPVLLALENGNGGDSGEGILCAMQNGDIGVLNISRGGSSWKWMLTNEKKREMVKCLCWYDIYKDGTQQLIVGREDGSLQIYGEPLEPSLDGEPLIEKYNYACSESITSVQAGNVANPAFDEILVTTFTGWFFGLTTEVLDKQVSWENNNMSIKMAPEEKQKIENLRAEIEELERNLSRERETYQMSTKDDSIGISAIPHISINDKMTFLKDDFAYQLSLEAETAIDNVLLQSNVNINLLDVEKNSAVVSHSACLPNSGSKLLATYRCQVDTSKMNIILQYGNESGYLNVYITPHAQPKTTQLKQYVIRRLGMLSRTHDLTDMGACNVLRLKGGFSQAEMHNWISLCLPQVPEKIPATTAPVYYYISSFANTQLQCSYSKGEAEFRSDDITIISTLKDFLTYQATMKKIHLDITFELNNESMKHILEIMYPKMREEIEEQKEALLYEALRDIEQNEGEAGGLCMTEYCRKIIEKQRKNVSSKNIRAHRLEKIQEYILALYRDWFKFQDVNVKGKIDKLKECLWDCNQEDLLAFFLSSELPTPRPSQDDNQ